MTAPLLAMREVMIEEYVLPANRLRLLLDQAIAEWEVDRREIEQLRSDIASDERVTYLTEALVEMTKNRDGFKEEFLRASGALVKIGEILEQDWRNLDLAIDQIRAHYNHWNTPSA